VEHQLSTLYLHVCRAYDNQPDLKDQRLSTFPPRCTDEELLTLYLLGHRQGFHQQRRIDEYGRRHGHAWFPLLPSYQAFNRHLNELVPAFEPFISSALAEQVRQRAAQAHRLIDSLPSLRAKGSRSSTARVAKDMADTGFGASHNSYYYGVKLHALAMQRIRPLPRPARLPLSRASPPDLAALRELNPTLGACYLFGDKAMPTKRGKLW
jgi:hypothetical protein